MSVTPFDLASSLGVLSVGRDPSGQTHAVSGVITNPPIDAADGAPLQDAVVALLSIDVRENVSKRTTRIRIPTLVIGDTFTLTIDGGTAAYDSTGDADLDEVMTSLRDAINADADVNTTIVARVVDSTQDPPVEVAGSNDELIIEGLGNADYSVDFTRVGSSVLSVIADPTSCEAFMYAQRGRAPNTTANTRWRRVPGSYVIDSDGYMERWNIAGLARLYVRLGSIAGPGGDGSGVVLRTPDIDIAPGIAETS